METEGRKKEFRIAMIGMRGLPADLPKAGGGERETEAKASRLAARGHQVTVYCRWHYNKHPDTPYNGVNLTSLPSIPTKNLDTVTHTFLAALHVLVRNTADIVNFHGMGNALFLPLVKIFGKKTVVYMDGIDWDRPKWGKLASFALKIAAKLAFYFSDVVYVDNRASQIIFKELFGKEPLVITLAADIWPPSGALALEKYGLKENSYILFVGLLRPDKGVHLLIEAYNKLNTDLPLVIVGANPEDPSYENKLKQMANQNVKFLGFVYGDDARQLFSNCYIYVQPSVMEGNSPALMSAMACGRCVVVNGIEQNLETIAEAGIAFSPGSSDDLNRKLFMLINDQKLVESYGLKARERINKVYNWENVVDQLEAVYSRLS